MAEDGNNYIKLLEVSSLFEFVGPATLTVAVVQNIALEKSFVVVV